MSAHNGLLQTFAEARAALSRFLVTRGATPDEADEILQELHLKLLTENMGPVAQPRAYLRSEEHTSELQSLMRISYAVFCLKKKKETTNINKTEQTRHTQHT